MGDDTDPCILYSNAVVNLRLDKSGHNSPFGISLLKQFLLQSPPEIIYPKSTPITHFDIRWTIFLVTRSSLSNSDRLFASAKLENSIDFGAWNDLGR